MDEFMKIINPKDLDLNSESHMTFLREEVILAEINLPETENNQLFLDITFVQSQKINYLLPSAEGVKK